MEMLDSFQVEDDIHRGAKWERKKLGCISASAPGRQEGQLGWAREPLSRKGRRRSLCCGQWEAIECCRAGNHTVRARLPKGDFDFKIVVEERLKGRYLEGYWNSQIYSRGQINLLVERKKYMLNNVL